MFTATRFAAIAEAAARCSCNYPELLRHLRRLGINGVLVRLYSLHTSAAEACKAITEIITYGEELGG